MSMDFNNLSLIMEEIENCQCEGTGYNSTQNLEHVQGTDHLLTCAGLVHEGAEFEANGSCGEISSVLEEFLRFVAKTGDPLLPWNRIKGFLRYKLSSVMGEFFEHYGGEETLETTNTPSFSYVPTRNKILQHFDSFVGAPFTIQRLCEILIDPCKHYKRTDKFLRGLEKNILVVSFIEPGHTKKMREQQNMANGLQDMSPPHIMVGSMNDKKGKSVNSPFPLDDIDMLQVGEGGSGIAATTNGVGDDSSSSSSSSSSSASSPTLDEDSRDMGPMPKRPRLDPSVTDKMDRAPEGGTTAPSPADGHKGAPSGVSSPPRSPIRDEVSEGGGAPMPPSDVEAEGGLVVAPKGDEENAKMVEDDEEEEEESAVVSEASECSSRVGEVAPNEEKDAALGFPALSPEVGSSSRLQEDEDFENTAPRKQSFGEGSPDSAQDSVQPPEHAASDPSFKDTDGDSEATAAFMRRTSEGSSDEESTAPDDRPENPDLYGGSEADSTSFQSNPLPIPLLSSSPTVLLSEPLDSISSKENNAEGPSLGDTSSTTNASPPSQHPQEEKVTLDSSTTETPPLEPDQPQTQVISTSHSEEGDLNSQNPRQEEEASCSSSHP